jgi:multidrug efflux system outer membrane protein
MRGFRVAIPVGLLVLLAGCMVGPNYKRPAVNVPPTYRGPAPAVTGEANAASLGDEKWWSVFQDEELQKLIRAGLSQNFDVRIAATRILQAQAQLVITRANQFPSASAGASLTGVRSPSIPGAFPGYSYIADELSASVSWNLDFWGKYRRATQAARATLLSAQWSQRAVVSTFIENLATAYFQLRDLDLQLAIANQTLASRQQSLKLTQTLEQGGATSLVDVRQAEQLVEEAAGIIPETERQIAQTENQISVLTGENPHSIPRGRKLEDEPLPETVPAGIPSRLLERRPDVQQAEQDLVAANARIGVARAQLFPEISLTGQGGLESIGLGNLFTPSNRTWTYAAGLTQPIFNAGSLRANVRLAEAQDQQYLLTYEQTIQTAFREVSDSLFAYRKYRDYRVHQEALTTAAQQAANLSEIRYRGGVTSYLEVLTNETTYFNAELNLAQARLNERLSLVQLYNALGGGWEQ